MTTLEDGLISTCLLPRFSALYMLLRESLRTLIRTIVPFRGLAQGGFDRAPKGEERGRRAAAAAFT